MAKTFGILLCSWGKICYGYAAFNLAASIKSFSRDVPITLIADGITMSQYSDQHKLFFDEIKVMGEPVSDPGLFKVSIYDKLPYDYTLFLDVDALCINDVNVLLRQLISDYETTGKFYRVHVYEWYNQHSPDDMPMMYWAKRSVIWQKYGFSDHDFPGSQSSIQFIAKCHEAEKFYSELVATMRDNPIPLDELKNKWGGTQPDELYLNIQIAKDRLKPDIKGSMWFCDDSKKRPHQLQQEGYTFLSFFGIRARMKTFFLEYYDKTLIQTLRRLGFANHYWKSHNIFQDKHAGNKVKMISRVAPPTPVAKSVVPLLAPHIKSNGWGLQAFENRQVFSPSVVPTEPLTGTVHLYLTNFYQNISGARKSELMKCHEFNCNNPAITKIFNFGNIPFDHPKVVNIPLEKRMTYQDMIDYANTTGADYHVLTNSDLYYDHTLNWLSKIDFNNRMLAMCRWDFDKGVPKLEAYSWSQGTWIFKGKIKLTGMAYTIGLPGCENAMAFDAEKQGYTISNPAVDIKAFHLHATNERTYTQADRIHGNGYKEILLTPISRILKKKVLIIQPGAVGDIIRVLPIARYYSENGYLVSWFAPEKFHGMLKYAPYLTPVATPLGSYDLTIDLSFGINKQSAVHKIWLSRQKQLDSFVTLKYELANVPLSELNNLSYSRNTEKEDALFNLLGINKTDRFALVHANSNYGTAADIATDLPVIDFTPIEGYTIFDWRKVIESAAEIHGIDSSLVNFVDALPVVLGKLFYYKTDKVPNKWDETLLTKNWTRINQMEYVA